MEKQPLIESSPFPTGAAAAGLEPEPSLQELRHDALRAQRRYITAWQHSRTGRWQRRFLLGITAVILSVMAVVVLLVVQDALAEGSDYDGYNDDNIDINNNNNNNNNNAWPSHHGKVPLEAHIMSKCPDATDCLRDLILPVMQQVSERVEFRLSYIGTTTDHDDGVLCMHGQEECLGNIIQLCAAHLYPDPKIYLGFTMCMAREYRKIPQRALLEDCALEHGIDFQRINECTTDDDGQLAVDRLKASFNHSASVGVATSCTVRLNNQVRCVRDDGQWSHCEGGSKAADLVQDIMDLSASYY